ncbi:MAG: hypothetical protein CVU48_03740, partial [Candidatus Cloacimonetes bacterium HGW-Cloacimonetes-1]
MNIIQPLQFVKKNISKRLNFYQLDNSTELLSVFFQLGIRLLFIALSFKHHQLYGPEWRVDIRPEPVFAGQAGKAVLCFRYCSRHISLDANYHTE